MPYIRHEKRREFDSKINELVGGLMEAADGFHPGAVNYCLSRIIWVLWKSNPNYTRGNDLMGVLECVKQEFYRRMLGPYEDEKWADNGDIV